jgi:hypothetical protein
MIPPERNRACLGLKTDLAQEACGTTIPERYYIIQNRLNQKLSHLPQSTLPQPEILFVTLDIHLLAASPDMTVAACSEYGVYQPLKFVH